MSQLAMMWMMGHDTGISSKAIWARMMGVPGGYERRPFGNYPHDPDDFGRCYRLLKLMPEWRRRIGEMADESPTWAGLVAVWDELETLYESEVDRSGPYHRGRAEKLYARMRAIRDETEKVSA